MMNENNYFDIELSDTKVTGMGFATEIYDQRIPFVFGNFQDDAQSVSTFLHENGHALQEWLTMKRFDLMELYGQVQDISEVPSKTMELFSYEYADLFFGDDAQKYILGHITGFLNEIGNYCMFHEFETYIYNNPEADIQDWIKKYNELCDLYNPGIEYVNPELREKGCALCMNAKVFAFPRYLITYSLCDLSAFYLASEFKKDKVRGAELFKKLGRIGSSMDYADSLASLGLKPAYEEEIIKEIAEYLKDKLQLS
jgi:oligoendopeptidase F